MRNSNAVYILLDATNRTVLTHFTGLESVLWAKRHLLDTRVTAVLNRDWETRLRATSSGAGFYSYQPLAGTLTPLDDKYVSDLTRQRSTYARLWTQGHAYLLWYTNLVTEAYWSTDSLDYGDLDSYYRRPDEFHTQFSLARGIPIDQAAKQLQFDAESLDSALPIRKALLWKHGQTLLQVQDQSQLAEWKHAVYLDVIALEPLKK